MVQKGFKSYGFFCHWSKFWPKNYNFQQNWWCYFIFEDGLGKKMDFWTKSAQLWWLLTFEPVDGFSNFKKVNWSEFWALSIGIITRIRLDLDPNPYHSGLNHGQIPFFQGSPIALKVFSSINIDPGQATTRYFKFLKPRETPFIRTRSLGLTNKKSLSYKFCSIKFVFKITLRIPLKLEKLWFLHNYCE